MIHGFEPIAAAERPGSLDSSIKPGTEVVNDFSSFLRAHPGIGSVFFNGAKAETLFRRFVVSALPPACADLRLRRLPSTSPANAALSQEDKVRAWRQIIDALGVG